MDATRPRRFRDHARQVWYAHWRSLRFARHLGFFPTIHQVPKPPVITLQFPWWIFQQDNNLNLCG